MLMQMAYKTVDGRLFEAAEQAIEHEKFGILKERISAFEESLIDGKSYDTPELIMAWEKFKVGDILLRGVETLNLPIRSYNCLMAEDLKTIGDLVRQTTR